MSRFIETIRLEDGVPCNMAYHNARANNTRREVLGIDHEIGLEDHIRIPEDRSRGIVRCRVTYGEAIFSVELEEYEPRPVRTLKMVDGGTIDYRYKYADRSQLEALFAWRGACDDVLIVQHGLITDTSYANIAFFDGRQWVTPAVPLLRGTRRQELLDIGLIVEGAIRADRLKQYQEALLFNAMRPFDPGLVIRTEDILT